MARNYEELKELIYVQPERSGRMSMSPDSKGKQLILRWYGDYILGNDIERSRQFGGEWRRVKIEFQWDACFDMPDENTFKSQKAYYLEYEKRANEIINQFTDEELFLVAAKGYGYEDYVRGSSYNKVDRHHNASFEIHKTTKPALITIETYFRKKERQSTNSDGCYITTAICSFENKADDCYELEKFRFFRDNWLLNQDDGKDLINEYYNTAPQIVKKIDVTNNVQQIYSQLRKEYLNPCLAYIEQGKFEECKELYVKMVRMLQNKYLYNF